jgi:hypothetical protein
LACLVWRWWKRRHALPPHIDPWRCDSWVLLDLSGFRVHHPILLASVQFRSVRSSSTRSNCPCPSYHFLINTLTCNKTINNTCLGEFVLDVRCF